MLGPLHVLRVVGAIKFLFVGPLVFLMLVVINGMTSPGVWWIQWPALGLGIAWVVSLLRVLKAALLAGGIAALISCIAQRRPVAR